MGQVPVLDDPSRRLRDAIEPLAMHPVWSSQTRAALGDLGLSRLTAYVWGRAAALGEPTPGVVTATFAVFEPGWLHSAYGQGRAACDRATLLTTRAEATTASLRRVLDGIDVSRAATALQAAVVRIEGTGRPLFSGLADLAWSDDPVEVLWRSAEMAREHRGDGHVAVCVQAGLSPVAVNILTELWLGMTLGEYTATRGWSELQIAATADELRGAGLVTGTTLTEAGRTLRDDIEAATNRADRAVVDGLGADADAIIDQLAEWSQRCIDAGEFTDNAHKRAAG